MASRPLSKVFFPHIYIVKWMDHSGDESLLKQQNKLPWNAVGFVFNILHLLFWSIWQVSDKRSSHRNQLAILFVSETNLVLLIHFNLHLSYSASSLLPPKADKGERKATKSRATADTKNTTKMGFQSSRPQEMSKQICCCSCFWASPQSAWMHTTLQCLDWLWLLKG